ncbi:MAG: response regulator [Rhodospirillales bacterium]|nr:response regulator [Rhodospirillales bacterium]
MNYAKIRALVIDDQMFARRIVTTLLRQIGFAEVSEACDGAAGLEEVERLLPDVVICDIEMAPMDGLAFLEALREKKGIPMPKVLFLTNHGESDIVLKARDLGVDAFILKPVTGIQLKRRIDHVFHVE